MEPTPYIIGDKGHMIVLYEPGIFSNGLMIQAYDPESKKLGHAEVVSKEFKVYNRSKKHIPNLQTTFADGNNLFFVGFNRRYGHRGELIQLSLNGNNTAPLDIAGDYFEYQGFAKIFSEKENKGIPVHFHQGSSSADREKRIRLDTYQELDKPFSYESCPAFTETEENGIYLFKRIVDSEEFLKNKILGQNIDSAQLSRLEQLAEEKRRFVGQFDLDNKLMGIEKELTEKILRPHSAPKFGAGGSFISS